MKKIFNNEININNIGETVTLYGWVQKKRNLGGLIFIDLRDRSGIIQLVIKPESSFYSLAESLKSEYVIEATGKVIERENKNKNIATGEVEVLVESLKLINESLDIPFEISKDTTALEDTRLKYRYLDLRRENIKDNLILRHKVTMIARNFLSKLGFIEVETPILCKSTPEGARDYLVPSRIFNGKFYALPQSPQLYKQLLMVGGIEKYFQVARCFRDEDLRADRQPEFTQIDIEMSFAEEEDIWHVVESLMKEIFLEIKGIKLDNFIRLTYDEAIRRFGSDKPDTRFDMEITDVTDIFKNTEFGMYKDAISNKGVVNCLVVRNASDKFSRKDIDKLNDSVKVYKAGALAYLKYNEELTGSIAKVISDTEKDSIIKGLNLKENDLVLLVSGSYKIVKNSLGALRVKLGNELGLIDENKFNFLWVTEFPMYEFSEEENRFVAAHHPFTSPRVEDLDKLLTDKEHCYSRAYDLVLNGYELLSGSIRIHDGEVQRKVFEAIGLTEEEAKQKFGFFLEAFKYGAPPHGGVGIGLERLIMVLAGTENIRDVVAFPKTANATCLMSDAPNMVDDKQLKELGIGISNKNV
ncbi:MAG: aspartate--tRNA ligase [bacterium]|nr:aspartate--tRNA ligase [bacterium]